MHSASTARSVQQPMQPPFKAKNFKLPKPETSSTTQPTLEQLFYKMHEKGAAIEDPHYEIGYFRYFMYAFLIQKYANSCLLDRISLESYDEPLVYYTNKVSWKQPDNLFHHDNLVERLKGCVRRGTKLILIPFTIIRDYSSHANLLIFRPATSTVERFEPYGTPEKADKTEQKLDAKIADRLKRFFADILGRAVTYRSHEEICPFLGPQSLEEQIKIRTHEGIGYCIMWTTFFMEALLLNPTMDSKEVIEKAMAYGKNDPKYFRNLIRGYTKEIAEQTRHFLKKYVSCDIGSKGCSKQFNKTLYEKAHDLFTDAFQAAENLNETSFVAEQ
jgi:hypothetical protein